MAQASWSHPSLPTRSRPLRPPLHQPPVDLDGHEQPGPWTVVLILLAIAMLGSGLMVGLCDDLAGLMVRLLWR